MKGFEPALDEFSISDDFASDIAHALNDRHLKIKEKLSRERKFYFSAQTSLEKSEDELYEDLKRGIVSEEMYSRKLGSIREERQRISTLLLDLQDSATETYLHTAQSILELAKEAKSLWLSRSPTERVEFLKKLLWNPKITGRTIEYQLRKPFAILSEMRKTEEWGAYLDSFGTACMEWAA